MIGRKDFIKQLGLVAGAFSVNSIFNELNAADIAGANHKVANINPLSVAGDEDYWSVIQQAYTANANVINLNNGGVSPSPRIVQEAVERYNKWSNDAPSYYMWRILDQGREPLRERLAELAGCNVEEVAINRNCTEALNNVIFGIDLKPGDEVLGCLYDYPNHYNAWKQRAKRDKIVYKQIELEFPTENEEVIVEAYRKAITPKTKVLHITHVINWSGQILPVRKIADMARKLGVQEIICDGAHSFALLDFKIPDLGVDYFGTSLHKFLSAPIGSGMLWVKKDKIAKLWPLMSTAEPESDDIRKFETLGTRSFPIEQGIGEAINFQNAIGNKRKEDRIRYLKNYWAKQVLDVPKVKIHTSLKDEFSCGICGVSIDGLTPQELESTLLSKYKIHTSPMKYERINWVRVTPHVYTKLNDLDKLVRAIKEIAHKGK